MSLSLYPRWRNKMYLFIYLFLNNSCNAFLDGKHQATIGGRQGRVPEPTQRAEIRHSAVTDSRHQITALDDRCKVR